MSLLKTHPGFFPPRLSLPTTATSDTASKDEEEVTDSPRKEFLKEAWGFDCPKQPTVSLKLGDHLALNLGDLFHAMQTNFRKLRRMCKAGVPVHVLTPCQLCKLGMGVVGTQEDPGPAETVVHGNKQGLAGKGPRRNLIAALSLVVLSGSLRQRRRRKL